MGYTTEFSGQLKFKKEPSASELGYLNTILGEDCREHPEWNAKDLTHIDFELSKDFSGIEWDGSEKFYDAVEKTNLITRLMRVKNPEFSFVGSLLAQGESIEDRWKLNINENGIAEQIDIVIEGTKVVCPHCEESFYIESEK